MAFGPGGGVAGKLGLRYEYRWVLDQLLCLLNERLVSVTVEALGDDEHGVDLWVERNDGVRQAQQCRARNRSSDTWTLGALNAGGVLQSMRFQLERAGRHEFTFVSAIPFSRLNDLCESIQGTTTVPLRELVRHTTKTRDRKDLFDQFCRYLSLNPGSQSGLAVAVDLLRRFRVCQFPDDRRTVEDLEERAGTLICAQAETVLSHLRTIVENNLGTTWTADTLWRALEKCGLYARHLARDPRVLPRIRELQTAFEDSIRPHLIHGRMIHRPETDRIIEARNSNQVIVVHGEAGTGKSAILYELTQSLQQASILYVPIRLDHRTPVGSARRFGEDLGLPDSPIRCLSALSGGKPVVLLLDQLDSLRWTGSRGTEALDVCRELVRQAGTHMRDGVQVCVIIACRSFDLRHDPVVKEWLKEEKPAGCAHVSVGGLPPPVVREVVNALGGRYERLPARQRHLLETAQNLQIWAAIAETGRVPEFRSSTQLMREFWRMRYEEFDRHGIEQRRADSTIRRLAAHMQENNRAWAPERLIEDGRVSHALQSAGILQREGARVWFSHQSYLDFHVAKQALNGLEDKGGSIRDWLGPPGRQAPARRNQLRYLLSMVWDEDPGRFLVHLREIIEGPAVRFHLKHLALCCTGEIDEPTPLVAAFALDLMNDAAWRNHVLGSVYAGHAPYVQGLANDGVLQSWLNSGSAELETRALWLLRTVADGAPDLVPAILEPLVARGPDWAKRIQESLFIDANTASDRLFGLLLLITRLGIAPPYVDWQALAKANPRRVIRLLDAIVSNWCSQDQDATSRTEEGMPERLWCEHENDIGAPHLTAILAAAGAEAELTLDALLPHIARLTEAPDVTPIAVRDWHGSGRSRLHLLGTEPERTVVLAAREAGKVEARNAPNRLLQRTRPYQGTRSVVIRELLVEAYACLPPQYADAGLRWFMSDLRHFAIGSGCEEPEWMPAARLIEGLSPHCSDELYGELEAAIFAYHAPDERRQAEWMLPARREGHYRHWHGQAQYFLLPRLPRERRSVHCEAELGVLQRKFAGYANEGFLHGGKVSGGWIVSPVHDRLFRLSDKAWLNIVSNRGIPLESRGVHWKQLDEERAAASTIEQFASSLRTAAESQPERFGRLALQFPQDTHHRYIAAVLSGLACTKPSDDVPKEGRPHWQSASPETVEAVLARFGSVQDRDAAIQFCWLIQHRPAVPWSETILRRLADLALTHPDPEPTKLNMYCDQTADVATVGVLHQNTINCVRGTAAIAIGGVLFSRPELFPFFADTIQKLIADPHPAVRMAAIEPLVAMLSLGGDQADRAIFLFLTACRDDLRIAAYDRSTFFFNYGIKTHFRELGPLLRQMMVAERDDVAEAGTEGITAYWLYEDLFADDIAVAQAGRPVVRKAVASVAARYATEERCSAKARLLLVQAFQDADADVRREAASVFGRRKESAGLLNSELALALLHSPAFLDDPLDLLRALDETTPLLPYKDILFTVCEVGRRNLTDNAGVITPRARYSMHRLSPLTIRLYEEACDARDEEVSGRCLDILDALIADGVGDTREIEAL